jgi:hypothetical protein
MDMSDIDVVESVPEQDSQDVSSDRKLIEAIKKVQYLWDIQGDDYKNIDKKNLAWQDIALQLGSNAGMYCMCN